MTDKTEKFLKPIKEICVKIETDEDCTEALDELKQLCAKGTFYEHHCFVEVLEVLKRKLTLPQETTKAIFRLLSSSIHSGASNKDSIIKRLYQFTNQNKSRSDLVSHLVLLCNFNILPTTNIPEALILLSEVLLLISQNSVQRQILFTNFKNILKKHGSNETVILTYWQSLNRSVVNLTLQSKQSIAFEYIEEVLIGAIHDKTIGISNSEKFNDLFAIFVTFAKYGSSDDIAFGVCVKLCNELKQMIKAQDQKECNEILLKVFNMCLSPTITEAALYELVREHYKKPIRKNELLEKTALFISKLLTRRARNFELTPDCFNTFHSLCFGMYQVYQSIKNDEKVFPCCSDVKRHETHNLTAGVYNFAAKLAHADKFNPDITKKLLYHFSFDLQVCNDLKCQSKNNQLRNIYNHLYNIMFDLIGKSEKIKASIEHVNEFVKILYKLCKLIPEELKTEKHYDPSTLAMHMYEAPKEKQTAIHSANFYVSLIRYRKAEQMDPLEFKKSQMKLVFAVREAAKEINFSTATDFVKSKYFNDFNLDDDAPPLKLAEFIHLEISTIDRYCPNEHLIGGKLFSALCAETKDPFLLARTCHAITDTMLKNTDFEGFKKVNTLLEKQGSNQFNVDISLAAAFNNYSIYFSMIETVPGKTKDDLHKLLDVLELDKEFEYLQYLNNSLQHFTDVVHNMMQHKEDLAKIPSMKRVLTMLNNISMQYYIKGIKNKDLEAFTLLWHLSQASDQPMTTLLNVGTFFLDNHELLMDSSGNYIKVSKKLKQLTIAEITTKINKMIDDEAIPDIENQSEVTQCLILSYLLSLWVYYVTTGRKADGFKRWNQFDKLWKGLKIPKHSVSRETVHAKLYYCLVEINLSCFNRSADNFLSIAGHILLGARSVDREFTNQFYQIYHRITLKAINYSINRLSDMNHYDKMMSSMLLMAVKRGNSLKTLELLSLSILRHLNMEKLDNAKTELKQITKLVGLKETILVETPTSKVQVPVTVFDYDLQEEKVRKAVVQPSSPIQVDLSMIYDDRPELSKQLETFIHVSSCNCEICKIPQLRFIMFQIGCHYSRLLWMTNKFDVSKKFADFAIDNWRSVFDKLRRTKDCQFLMVNKQDFAVFSIRWLFQCADTLIRLEKYQEAEEIYQEVELVCVSNVPDYECQKQALYCRKENLNFLMEHGANINIEEPSCELSFTEFLKRRGVKETPVRTVKRPSPRPTPLVGFAVTSQKKEDVIYIDLSDDECSVVIKPPRKASTKSTTPELTVKPTPKKTSATPKPSASKPKTEKLRTATKVRIPEKTEEKEPARRTRRKMI